MIANPGHDTEAMLRRALYGWTAVLGPALPRVEAGSSLRWPRMLLMVTTEAVGEEGRLIRVFEHLPTLLLLQGMSLVRLLTDRWLRPLAELPPHQADRITQTMLTWLESGSTAEAARRLWLQPQSVRHRMRRIERILGISLQDPRCRFELELALRGSRLLAGTHGARSPA